MDTLTCYHWTKIRRYQKTLSPNSPKGQLYLCPHPTWLCCQISTPSLTGTAVTLACPSARIAQFPNIFQAHSQVRLAVVKRVHWSLWPVQLEMPASHVDQLKLKSIPLDGSIPSTTTGDCTAGGPTGAPTGAPTTGALGPTGAGNSAPASKPTALGASKGRGSWVFCVGFLLRGIRIGSPLHHLRARGIGIPFPESWSTGDIRWYLDLHCKIIHVSYSPLGSLRAIRPLFRAHHLTRSRAAFFECACH